MLDISVISACQTDGLVSALKLLLPHARISGFGAHLLIGEQRAAIQRHVIASDIVFAMRLPAQFEEYTFDALQQSTKRLVCLPQLDFGGFHPDIVYIATDRGWAQSPTADYHSNICIAAFLCGLPAKRAAALYNAFIFGALGYFEEFERSRRNAIQTFADEGIEIEAQLGRWERYPVPFMYTTNHPKPFVIADLASAACKRASIKIDAAFPYDFMNDRLATSFLLPVFPEIASRHYCDGHRWYRLAGGHNARVMSVEEHVSKSFDIYENVDMSTWRLTARTSNTVTKLRDLLSISREEGGASIAEQAA